MNWNLVKIFHKVFNSKKLGEYPYIMINGKLYIKQKTLYNFVRDMSLNKLDKVFLNDDILSINNEECYTIEQLKRYISTYSKNYLKSDILLDELSILESIDMDQEEKSKNELNLESQLKHKQNIINTLVKPLTLTKREMIREIITYQSTPYEIKEKWRVLYNSYNLKRKTNITAKMNNYNKKNKGKGMYRSKVDYIEKELSDIDTLFELAVTLFETNYSYYVQRLESVQS